MRARAVMAAWMIGGCGGAGEPPAAEPSAQGAASEVASGSGAKPAKAVPATAPAKAAPTDAYWVKRSDAELDAALKATCEAAVAADEPVLLAFSAPWCIDCKTVRGLEAQSPLKEELDGWQELVVDVGRFDRHPALLEAFEVGAIARWVALRPTACDQPVASWPRLRADTFEPATGQARTAADLATWLQQARGS